MSNMPILPVETMVADFDASNASIVRAAFTNRGLSKEYKDAGYGRLRAGKPFKRVKTFEQGCANYVWRMLCFDLVGHGKHVCIPVCADFEIMDAIDCRDGRIKYGEAGYEDQREEKRNLMKRLDVLVDAAETALPVEAKKGILRWGRAFGMLG